jgi:hypothetical protein
MGNNTNPNHTINKLLANSINFKISLPEPPNSIIEPAFGDKYINSITSLYNKIYVPAINEYSKTHYNEKDTIKLLRFFGDIQLIIFKGLRVSEMRSLRRSKYYQEEMKKMIDGVTGILENLQAKGLEIGIYKEQIENYKQIISNLATKQGAAAGAAGGGRKKRAPKGKAKPKSKKASKGKSKSKAKRK